MTKSQIYAIVSIDLGLNRLFPPPNSNRTERQVTMSFFSKRQSRRARARNAKRPARQARAALRLATVTPTPVVVVPAMAAPPSTKPARERDAKGRFLKKQSDAG